MESYDDALFFSSDDVDVMITEAEYDKTTASLKEMLNAICDYAHDRCVKVMTARAKVNLAGFHHFGL